MQLITYFLCCSYFVSSLCTLKMKYHLRLNLDKTEEQLIQILQNLSNLNESYKKPS